jgi:hypothetical protein
LDRIKRKSRFYKREYDLLQEFIRKELDFEREKDEAAVDGSKRTIITFSRELENQGVLSGRHQEAEYPKLFQQIDAAKRHREERTVTLFSLEMTRAQTQAATDPGKTPQRPLPR